MVHISGYRFLFHLMLGVAGLIFAFPFFWLLSTSFKTDREIMMMPPRWLPEIPPNVKVSPYLQNDVYRSLCTGTLTVQDVSRLEYDLYALNPAGWDGWKFHTSNLGPGSHLVVENNPALEIPYSFEHESKALMSYSVKLPRPLHEVDKITLAIHGDASFHKVNLIVETAGAVYKSDEDFMLDTDSWKSAVWEFRGPRQEDVLPSIRLVKVPGRNSSVTDTDGVKLTVIITKSPYLWAITTKFLTNYKEVTKYVPFLTYLRNTVILVVLNIIAQLFSCTLVAYGFARIRWPGRNVVFVVLLATMMLPGQVTMIPQFLIWKYLGMYNTWQPLWLHSLFGSAFFVFLLRQFFMTIPRDLEDAARIDGCGYFGVYWRIMLPQIKPALAAIAIFQFMGTWNDFMGPLIYISSDNLAPLALGLYTMKSIHASAWGMLMAASTMMALPAILIFLFAQRYFIRGVTFAGIKG
jgi:ABC-type glycerol-3-phosphate transport system permease component